MKRRVMVCTCFMVCNGFLWVLEQHWGKCMCVKTGILWATCRRAETEHFMCYHPFAKLSMQLKLSEPCGVHV